MNCPKCNAATKVIDRRNERRRRECLSCGHRFSTIEMIAERGSKLTVSEPVAPVAKEAKPRVRKPTQKPSAVTVGVIKRNADARRKLEDMREAKSLKDDFDFMDDDYNYLPDKW